MRMVYILYTSVLAALTFFSYLFIDPNLFYLHTLYSDFTFQHRTFTTILYGICIILFFVFYLLFLRLASKKLLDIQKIKLLINMTMGVLFFSYPAMLSFDIFNYIATAKVLSFYQENPYIIMPIEFIGDPLLDFMHAANKIALYGPAWIILSLVPYSLSFGNFIFTLFTFKLFIVIFYLATVFLIWKMTKNHFSVAFFALNPLVVIETLISGHNDIVMMFFALVSFYFLRQKRILLGTVFIIISILIKYATIFLLPVFIYALWKVFWRQKINWEKIFYFSALLMMTAFFLSPIREEIYPWYATWFLAFAALVPSKKVLLYTCIAFSFGFLFRYVPFMLFGTYLGITPIFKLVVTWIPPFLVLLYYGATQIVEKYKK